MDFKKLGLWGVFCVLSISVLGQHNLKKGKKVTWEDPISVRQENETIHLLQFSGMGDVNPENKIPFLSESIKLSTSGKPESLQVSVEDKEYVWPTPEEHGLFLDKINNQDVEYTYSVSRSGGQYYLDIDITPVIRPEGAPSFKKLVSYTVNISYNTASRKFLKSNAETFSYADNSVLSSGSWVKVSVSESGIHKISYSKLRDWGVTNPQNVGIYGNGGKMIPKSNDEFRHDDLVENAVWHYNDAVYFYAEGPVVWSYDSSAAMFVHSKHKFSDYSYYFVTEKSSSSKDVSASDLGSDSYNKEADSFTDFDYHEEDNYNLINSGNVWFGEKFDYYSNQGYNYNFTFPNAVSGAEARVYAKLAARSSTISEFELSANDELVDDVRIYNVNTSSHTSYYARDGVINNSFVNNSDDVTLRVNYNLDVTQASSIGYMDYLCVNVDRELKFKENELVFRNMDMVGDGNLVKYNVSDGQGLTVWDITDPLTPLSIESQISGTNLSFNYKADALREFVAFDPSGSFPSPGFVEDVVNQDLHATPAVNYVIVCHPDYKGQAERLGQIHNSYNGTTYVVATTDQIYNEFSSGKPDVTAIRSFVKMLYDRAGLDNSKKPHNLLLFGDASYDTRPGMDEENNKVLCYQSDNSIHNTNSFVSDDYMGLLDEGEGENIKSDKVDIGIGRFPVNTLEEAQSAVDKTYKYLYEQSRDTWKSQLTFIGDDGDNNIHMTDANSLTIKLESSHPEFDITKLYFDMYEKVTTTSVSTIPGIEEGISEAISNGTLVFNYTGHGGTSVLAHEHVVEVADINSWNNIDKLSLFVTATCEFSRFDEKETSAGEMVFLNPLGGGIALFSTTRIVYSSLNKALNHSFYDIAFERDSLGKPYTLGQIMRHTKNNLSASVNKLNFSLLGDPALRLIYPDLGTNTLKLNDVEVSDKVSEMPESAQLDSLKALSTVRLAGEIVDLSDTSRVDFNGEIFVSVYDKMNELTTRGNDGATPFTYETFDNVIFQGPVTVSNGEFESEFIIPKDIRYNFGNGKVSYYAFSNENENEAFGAFSDVIVGGVDVTAALDDKGPEINLWLNSKSFASGGTVGTQPVLIAEISDESGINTTGNGIGHDITCVIDGITSNPIVLNNDFNATINSYKSGEVSRQLYDLEEGEHTLTVKAWDTHNNSSTATITFKVSEGGTITTTNVNVYPNPMVKVGSSYISFDHDDPNARMDIQLMLFDMSGQLLSLQNSSVVSLTSTIPPIEFKAECSNGKALTSGIYIYKLIINSQTGRKGEVSGKIMVTQ